MKIKGGMDRAAWAWAAHMRARAAGYGRALRGSRVSPPTGRRRCLIPPHTALPTPPPTRGPCLAPRNSSPGLGCPAEALDGTPGECCPVPRERAPPPAPSLSSRTPLRGRGTAIVRQLDGAPDDGGPLARHGAGRPGPLSSWSGRCRARPTSAASSVQEGGLAAESQLTRRQILEMGASLTYLTSLVLPLPAQSKSSNVPMEALKDKDYGKSVFRQVVGRLVKNSPFRRLLRYHSWDQCAGHSIS